MLLRNKKILYNHMAMPNESIVKEVSSASFQEEVLKSDIPVLVDFWAPWCGACRMAKPILEEFAKKHAGKIKVVGVNTDEDIELPNKYGVMALPTFIAFKDGEVAGQNVGVSDERKLMEICGILPD